MKKETVEGLPVFLRRTKHGYLVKWGRTVIARHSSLEAALHEIAELFGIDA